MDLFRCRMCWRDTGLLDPIVPRFVADACRGSDPMYLSAGAPRIRRNRRSIKASVATMPAGIFMVNRSTAASGGVSRGRPGAGGQSGRAFVDAQTPAAITHDWRSFPADEKKADIDLAFVLMRHEGFEGVG